MLLKICLFIHVYILEVLYKFIIQYLQLSHGKKHENKGPFIIYSLGMGGMVKIWK